MCVQEGRITNNTSHYRREEEMKKIIKEDLELERFELKKKEKLEKEDVDKFVEFTTSMFEQKKNLPFSTGFGGR